MDNIIPARRPATDRELGKSAGDRAFSRVHPLDMAVAWVSRKSGLFSRGWGDESVLAEFSDRTRYLAAPAPVKIAWHATRKWGRDVRRDGTFPSPVTALPDAVKTVHVRAWTREGNQAACVMLAASRDEGYWIRERVFGGLTGRGIDLYLVENPYYGQRRNGRGPSEITVSDHGLMALGMVLEARALLDHLRPQYRKLVVAGYSMGGHMAALTAAVTPLPVGSAVLATGASASAIYTRGLLSWSVDFDTLGGGVDGREAARERLRSLFDTADVTGYRPPLRADAAVVSGCTRDGYVLPSETERLHRHWRGCTLRWIEAGHFSALLTQRRALCECVEEAVAKL
jgi:pimeloyl-ACP methyl ester carboxylesterase